MIGWIKKWICKRRSQIFFDGLINWTPKDEEFKKESIAFSINHAERKKMNDKNPDNRSILSRDEWLNEECPLGWNYFKNKEFFPNLNPEDLDQVLLKGCDVPFQEYSHEHDDLSDCPIWKDKKFHDNFKDLRWSLVQLREYLQTPIFITSGFRSKRKHLDIYRKIAKRKGKVFNKDKVPMGSRHLFMQAVDFRTKDLEDTRHILKNTYCNKTGKVRKEYVYIQLEKWCDKGLNKDAYVEALDKLYFEHFSHTTKRDERNSWIHCQIEAPRSGNRFFKI